MSDGVAEVESEGVSVLLGVMDGVGDGVEVVVGV